MANQSPQVKQKPTVSAPPSRKRPGALPVDVQVQASRNMAPPPPETQVGFSTRVPPATRDRLDTLKLQYGLKHGDAVDLGIRFLDHLLSLDEHKQALTHNVAHSLRLKIKDKAEVLAYFTKLLSS